MFSDFIHDLMTRNHESNLDDLPVWCIGDVHGCTDQYEKILLEIKRRTEDCIIYQLGDLIDRGPDLYDVFLLSKIYNVNLLIGNHELNFIQEYFGYKYCRSKARRETHTKLAKLSEQQRDKVLDGMLSMRNYATVERYAQVWTLSHAPVIKDILVEEDSGGASSYCMGNQPYTNELKYDKCVHGHQHWNYRDIKSQVDDPEQTWLNVDAGCVYGGELVAIELGTKSIIRIPGTNWT